MLVRFKRIHRFAVLGLAGAVAACQVAPAPPPSAPPPPTYTPRAPTPPFGASASTVVPPLRADGLRQTINRDLGPLETVWHVRSALNVAALSCTAPQYARITDDYNLLLRKNKTFLANANRAIDGKFRREIGGGYKRARDRHMTSLYNYWSFSPLRRPFCDNAMRVSQHMVTLSDTQLFEYGQTALVELEKPFTDFYLAYEEYQRDLQAWRQQYGQGAGG